MRRWVVLLLRVLAFGLAPRGHGRRDRGGAQWPIQPCRPHRRHDPAPVLHFVVVEVPALARILCDFADINNTKVIESLVSGTVGREGLKAQAEAMRDGLGYKTSPDLERGLIEHVVLCWLRVQKAEMVYSQAQTVEMTLSKADWHERRLTAAHGRYMRACDSLARVRRMGRPSAFQINVGEQQVNVAGGAVAE